MRSIKVGQAGRRLILLSVLVVVLTTVAAANLTLIYVPFAADHSRSDLAAFLPVMVIGVVPFLLTAGLLARVIRSRSSLQAEVPGSSSAVFAGLPASDCPSWSSAGFGQVWGTFLGLENGTPAAYALTLYQFTFLAAVIADGISLVVALTTRTASRTYRVLRLREMAGSTGQVWQLRWAGLSDDFTFLCFASWSVVLTPRVIAAKVRDGIARQCIEVVPAEIRFRAFTPAICFPIWRRDRECYLTFTVRIAPRVASAVSCQTPTCFVTRNAPTVS